MRNVYLMILNLHLGALELGREAQQKLVVQIIHWSLGLGLPSCAKFKSHVPGCFHLQGMPVRSTVSRSSFFSSFSIHFLFPLHP